MTNQILSGEEAYNTLRAHGFCISRPVLYISLQENKLPFGYAIKPKNADWVYIVFQKDLYDWMKLHSLTKNEEG